VLIIDEIDFLKTRDEEVLYSIFEWTQKKKSQLIIISISNTLDFPETLTGKVASRMGRKTIGFKPYTSLQIEKILIERVGKFDVFHEQALSYICKKIAQCSSDIRKCLFILREAIAQFLVENDPKGISKKKITVDILAKTHEKIYSDTFAQNFHDFPSAYKIVLYCLAKYYRNDNTHHCTMRQLESLLGTFVKTREQLMPILSDLRDLGIIKLTYNYFKSGDANSITTLKFHNLKEMKEEHIKLHVEYDRIFAALQK
jgi:Cdc6-like AAA superfamily ATPase